MRRKWEGENKRKMERRKREQNWKKKWVEEYWKKKIRRNIESKIEDL